MILFKRNRKNIIQEIRDLRKNEDTANHILEMLEGRSYIDDAAFLELIPSLQGKSTGQLSVSLEDCYRSFCKQYVVELWNTYAKRRANIEDEYESEIVLAACGLLAGYDDIIGVGKLGKRRKKYATEAVENKIVSQAWRENTENSKKREDLAAEHLADWLIGQQGDSGKELGLVASLTKRLHEEYPNGLNWPIPFSAPRFLAKTALANTEQENIEEPQKPVTTPTPLRKPNHWKFYGFGAAALICVIALMVLVAQKQAQNVPHDELEVVSADKPAAPVSEAPEVTDPQITAAPNINPGDDSSFVNLDTYSCAYAEVGDADELAGSTPGTGSKEIMVERDKEYVIGLRVYHENENGANAQPARVFFEIPKFYGTELNVVGTFYAYNLDPAAVSSDVSFVSDEVFYIEYVPGSARIYNDGLGSHVLSDAITENGVLIGYDKLNGIVPSGEEYASYVTIRVRPSFGIKYTVEEMVRRQGDTEWEQSVDAAIGDKVEFLILYENTSLATQNGVVIRNVLPDNLVYVPGSVQTGKGTTYLYNANHPDGIYNNEDGSVVGAGINIGNYTAGSNAYVIFTAEVVDNGLADGTTEVVSLGQCGIGGTTLQDSASVFVTK